MKRFFKRGAALFLVLMLTVCGAAAAENPETEDPALSGENTTYDSDEEIIANMPEPGWVLDSLYGTQWQSDRAILEVFLEDTDNYKVLITWGGSASEAREWTYACSYDPGTQILNAEHVICEDIVYDEQGEESRTMVKEEDAAARFFLNDAGQVVIGNAGDEQLEGKAFDRMPTLFDQREGLHVNIQHETDSPDWVKKLPAARNATQLFIVAAMGTEKTTAWVSMHQKDSEGNWKQILTTPGFVGKNGLCPDADHAEGCGQTPMGVYHFNKAFGIAPNPGCALDYTMVNDDIYWSGDPERMYNQMVAIWDYPDLAMEDSEHIVDYEYQYQYCLNISFNEEGTPGRGSAIFLHCMGPQKPYTGGCVAIPENMMKMVMQQVQPDCTVVIDTMENLGAEF